MRPGETAHGCVPTTGPVLLAGPLRTDAAIAQAAAWLMPVAGESARLEAQLLLGHVTGWTRAQVLAHPEWMLNGAQAAAFKALIERRAAAEPIAYLLGEREFYGLNFKADRRALIPRPETELLVELGRAAVVRLRARHVEPVVVEVGTGSGALAVSLAHAADVRVIATDLAWAALGLARENAERLGQRRRVRLLQTNLLDGLRGPLHIVLANLPYVPRGRRLPPDVAEYEPAVALFGGERGTELIERLLEQATALLAPTAEVCVELDEEEQAAPVAALARRLYPSAEVSVVQDHGGYDRVVRVVLMD